MNFLFNKINNKEEKYKFNPNLYSNPKYHSYNNNKVRIYPQPLKIPNYVLPKKLNPEVIPYPLNIPKKIEVKPEIIKPIVKKNNNANDYDKIIFSLIIAAILFTICKSTN